MHTPWHVGLLINPPPPYSWCLLLNHSPAHSHVTLLFCLLSSQAAVCRQACILFALRAPYGTLHVTCVTVSEASCPNFEPRAQARFTGLTILPGPLVKLLKPARMNFARTTRTRARRPVRISSRASCSWLDNSTTHLI